jgi:1-aminocyclopropane-1-carboxylate deaminase/D-cysteine desulfhydrase-like pyridoxal-dependent ACC family enzyme
VELRRAGKKPFAIPSGGATPVGSAGYVNAVAEMCGQMHEQGFAADYVICACGSTGTQAGLVVGAKSLSAGFKVLGFSVSLPKAEAHRRILVLAEQTANLLGADCELTDDDVHVSDEYIGDGYGIPSAGDLEAIGLVARAEGVLLDPVYTGKAMAGLIDTVRTGGFKKTDDLVFLHTGGVPALFAYEDSFTTLGVPMLPVSLAPEVFTDG